MDHLDNDEMYQLLKFRYLLQNQAVTVPVAAASQAKGGKPTQNKEGAVQQQKQKEKKVASYLLKAKSSEEGQRDVNIEEAIKDKRDYAQMIEAYDPQVIEKYWGKWWEHKKFFHANPENVIKGLKKPYTIVIPPPNVTGYLHLGHALTNAIQDSLCRRKRMQGYETLYLPGTDHAGIATHTVVEQQLWKTEKLTRHDIGREKFEGKLWEWVNHNGNTIQGQLRKIGGSLDWERYRFTMDEMMSKGVIEAFIRFHDMGLIYRSNRLVHWSCKLRTAISDVELEKLDLEKSTMLEVPGHEGKYEFGVLIHFAYKIRNYTPEKSAFSTKELKEENAQLTVDEDLKTEKITEILHNQYFQKTKDPNFVKIGNLKIESRVQVPAKSQAERAKEILKVTYTPVVTDAPLDEIRIATTRIETMLGDVAVAVHPNDPRYKNVIGLELEHPFIKERVLKVIADPVLVDFNFGTGAVKVTPGHDQNDFDCGVRNKLDSISILDDEGRINQNGGPYKGMKRYDCRNKILTDLEALKLYRGKENNQMSISTCQRSKDIVEPMLRPQWYVRADEISKRMVEVVRNGELKIYPAEFEKIWYQWLENPRDWCISRQLWWGHRIPAYLVTVEGSGQIPDFQSEEDWVVATNIEQAIEKASQKYGVPASQIKVIQDDDVLDTWFSSGLFPFSTMGWPDNSSPDMNAFFPNAILETGHDILFFWVARMVMMSLLLTNKLPFQEVFLHPIIRDSEGRKMSKSLGNVIDPLEIIYGCELDVLIDKIKSGNMDPKEMNRSIDNKRKEFPEGFPECGSDALRFGLLAYMNQGRFINLDIKKVVSYRNFCNKIWQTFKFGLSQIPRDYQGYDPKRYKSGDLCLLNKWIYSRLAKTVEVINKNYDNYDFGDAITAFYTFWFEMCDNYLEAIKGILFKSEHPLYDQTLNTLFTVLETGIRLLHPMMPFITEELYQKLPDFKGQGETIVNAPYPENINQYASDQAEKHFGIILGMARDIRILTGSVEMPPSVRAESFGVFISEDLVTAQTVSENADLLCALGRIKSFVFVPASAIPKGCISQAYGTNMKIFVNVKEFIKIDKQIVRLEQKLGEIDKSIESLKKQMEAATYLSKVPQAIRQQDTIRSKKLLQERLLVIESIQTMKSI